MVHAPARDGLRDLRLPARHDDRAELLGPVPRPPLPDDRHDPEVGHRLVLRREADGDATPHDPAWAPAEPRARITGARVAIPAGLGALVALSLLLRTTELGIGFWIDEGLSVGIADRPLGDIPFALREDGSPPLYYMLLHFWLDLAGRSEAGVRGLSLLFALLAIPAAWWAGRRSGARSRAAWFAAVLMAFNPFLAQYAQEARMYSLVALLAIPATTCFIRAYALDTPKPAAVDRGLRGLGRGRALHAQLADLLHDQRRRSRGSLLWLLGRPAAPASSCSATACWASAALLVLYLPWVPTTLYQAAHTGAPWADAPALDSLLGVPGVLLGRMPQIVLLICAGAGLLALLRQAAAQPSAGGRALCLAIIARADADDRVALSQASPAWANRYLAVALRAVPAARRRRAGQRAPARHRRPACWS